MASSGTIWGKQVGARPRLSIYWKAVRQDIPNNRTEIEATLRLHSTYSLYFSANKTGSLDGTAFTYTSGFSGTGQVNLSTKKFWVNHNSDGTKTQSISGSLNIAVTYSGVYLSSISVSGNMSLDRIPRGSSLNSASITSLKNGTDASLTIGRTVHSSSFYHLVSIHDGNTWIWDSGYVSGSPSTKITVPASYVNKMLNRMGTVTSKSYTVSLRTYTGSGGSGQIGNVSRNMTASVHSDVKPTVNSPSVNIDGKGRDKAIGKYVQSFSRVYASMSGSAGYGATASSYSMVVRRVGGSDSQSISGSSGTTSRPVALSGSYEVIGTMTDSRGRSNTGRATFTVDAYSPPAITSFTAVRNSSAQTTVNIARATTHSLLGGGGNNNLTYSVQRRLSNGSWANVNTNGSGTITNSPNSSTSTSTGNAVTSSYEFRYVVTDQFGGRAESTVSVTTQQVVLDIHKNEGVGVGKLHEQGALDVGGDIFTDGLNTTGITQETDETMITQNNMGSFFGYSSTNTGVIVIEIPDRNIMFSADISIRSYDFNTILKVSGYTYYSTADWHSTSAIGTTNNMATVRFRTSGANGKRYITIGANTTKWGGYLQVQVSNVQSGYNARFPSKFKVSLSSTYPGDRTSAQYPIYPSEIESSGANSAGWWVRFSDGTQICQTNGVSIKGSDLAEKVVPLPVAFTEHLYTVSMNPGSDFRAVQNAHVHGVGAGGTSGSVRIIKNPSASVPHAGHTASYVFTGIGRWK